MILETGGQKIELEGLLDTGNCLTDTNTGKPVCVMEKSRFSAMLEKKQQALRESIRELEDSVAYIDWKQNFYDEVLAGKRPYVSNLIPTAQWEEEM